LTVSREQGFIYFECDAKGGCPEVCETQTKSFEEALDIMTTEGWSIIKDGNVWKHFCPDEEMDSLP